MTDSEMLARLLPPMPPGSGAAILRSFAASDGWRVDRIMGSGGVFVVEVTYLPLGCHGHIVCQPIGDDLYAVHQVGSAAQGSATPCAAGATVPTGHGDMRAGGKDAVTHPTRCLDPDEGSAHVN
jgi:hypothetical protein